MTNKADIVGAKAGAKPKKPYIQKDTVGSTQVAEMVYGIGDGENVGLINGLNSIILDGTRVVGDSGEVNYNEVKYEERFGLIEQEPLKLIEDTSTERGLNLEARFASPVVSTFNNVDVDKYVVRVSIPQLMQNKDNGDSVATSVSYAIDVAVDGGAYETVLETALNEKITNGYEIDHEIEAPVGSVRTIRVRRTIPDSTSQLISNKIYVAAITEVINAKFSHPTLHHIGLVFNAEQFNNIPKVVFHYKGRKIKVPTNYDPETRTYTGLWNGTFKVVYSNNPAWILYDILTDRRSGLGRRIPTELIDKWELYRIAQYCDELVPDGKGGMEPRFECNNLVLNSRQDAYQVLKDIASIFRGQSFWNGSQVVTVADAPRDIDYAISMASVLSYSYSGTARNARHNVVKVQYYDKNNENAAAYEYATDYDSIRETEQINEVEIRAFGCTSAGQAQRLARYTLLSEQTETRILTAKVALDSFVNMQLGDVFAWSDKFLAGADNGGRVVDSTGSVLTLDRDVTNSAIVGDTLVVNTGSGKASTRTITAVNGNKVTLDEALVDVSPEYVWVIDSSELSLLYFKLDDYKINANEHTVDIVGIQHVRSKFSSVDNDTALEAPIFSKVEIEALRAPENVTLNYNVRVDQGINKADLYAAWKQVKGATKYTVEFRRDDQSWRLLGTVTGLTHTIEDVSSGIYELRVRAADSLGNLSLYGYSSPISVAGSTLPPPKLNMFTATGKLLAIETKWAYPQGAESSLAVVIEHTTQNPADIGVVPQKLNIPYPQTQYTFNGLGAHTKMWFRAAILDKYGQEGEYSAWVTATADANPDELIDLISGHINEGTLDQTLKGKIDGAGALAGEAQTLANQAKTAAANAQTSANNAAAKAQEAANAAAKEATDRAAAITAETNARTAAISKEATDRATALTAQATTLKADSAAKVKALKDEVDPKIATLQNGITQVTTDYKAGDTAVVGQLNAYKTSNDRAVASVLQKAESAVSTGSTNSSAITAINGQLSTLEGSISTKADASALTALTTRVTDAEGVNTSQGTAITNLQNTINHATTGLASKASSAALTAVENKVTAANGRIDTTNSNVTALKGRVDTVEGAVSTKAEAAALTALTTRVTNAENTNTSQGTAITSLQNTVNHSTTGLATKASTAALNATNSEVTRIDGVVSGHTNQLTQLTSDITAINGTLATKANASALNDIYTKTQTDTKAAEIAAGKVEEFNANLVIGGTNLLSNTATLSNTEETYKGGKIFRQSRTASQSGYHDFAVNLFNLDEGDYTLSFDIKSSIDVPNTSSTISYFYNPNNTTKAVTSQGRTSNNADGRIEKKVTTVWQRIWITWTQSSAVPYKSVIINRAYSNGQDYTVDIANVKFEKGNKATDWTPSSADVQNSINANSTAISTTNAEVLKQDGRITANSNRIDNLSTSINNLSGSKLDASVIAGYYTKGQTDDKIETVSAGKIEEFKASLSYPSGENQIRNPDFLEGLAGWKVSPINSNDTVCESVVFNGKRAIKVQHKRTSDLVSFNLGANDGKNIRMEAGRKYEMSVLYIADNIVGAVAGNFKLRFGETKADGSDTLREARFFSSDTAGVWTKLAIPFTATENIYAGLSAMLFFVSGTIYLTEFTFIDVTDREAINTNSTAIQSINAEVTRVDGRVTAANNATTALAGRVSTVEGAVSTKAEAAALNALTTRVGTVEGGVASQGTAVTNLQNTINHATTGLASKASTAALSSLDSKVTAIDGTVSGHTSQLTNLSGSIAAINGTLAGKADAAALVNYYTKQQADEKTLSTAAGEISKYDASLVIGGANLLTNSMVLSNTEDTYKGGKIYRQSRAAATTGIHDFEVVVSELEAGDYTLSFDIKASINVPSMSSNLSYFYSPNSTTKTVTSQGYTANNSDGRAEKRLTTSWQRIWITWTQSSPADTKRLIINRIYSIGLDYSVDIANIKFEKGNKATAWTPSNSDVQSALTANATLLSDTRATVTQQGKDIAAQTSALNSAVSRISANEGKILNIQDTYATKNSVGSLAQTALQSVWKQDAKELVDGLSIGGRNLLVNTQYLNAKNPPAVVGGGGFTVQGFTANYGPNTAMGENHFVINSTQVERFIRFQAVVGNSYTLKPNATYTFSLKARGAAKPVRFRVIAYTTNGWADIQPLASLEYSNDVFSDQSYTFTIPQNVSEIIISLQSYSSAIGQSFAILNGSMKLEEGNKATAWTIAQEDVQTQLSANADAISTTKTEVSRIDKEVVSHGSAITNLRADLTVANNNIATKADASALSSLTTRVANAEGTISSEATKLSNLSTTVSGHTTTINSQTTSINGIRGVHALKIDTNGVISGYGLVSELINGQVKSQFGVNANTFFIGAPSNNKKPFVVLTGSGTINGVTVPAGTYIDTAFIGAATIGTAHINDLAVTTAKIGNGAITTAKIAKAAIGSAQIDDAAITNAKIGNLEVDTIKIKDNAVSTNIAVKGRSSVSITTAGSSRLVLVVGIETEHTVTANARKAELRVLRNGTVVETFLFKHSAWATPGDGTKDYYYNFVSALPHIVDSVAAGTHTYSVEVYTPRSWETNGGDWKTPDTTTWVKLANLALTVMELKK